ncbi:MAG: asparagine synthase (glutamine-hydrolyzing) [Acidobacteriota bacterium]
MCGIAGLSHPPMATADAIALTDTMLASLGHRGPEGASSVHVGDAMIGHAMLAFVVPRSPQPVVSDDGRVGLVFDGQVYNYRAIAREQSLPADTPEGRVVLEAYLRDGVGMLQRLRGMFGLAIVDTRDRSLLLARDPLGRKPLYYLWDGESVAFASELKALKHHPSFSDAIDPTATARYLAFNAVPAPLSIFTCIKKLRAGTCLRFAGGEATESVFWSLPPTTEDLELSEDEALDGLRRGLTRAVDRRVRGIDAPLGLALSGGIDSAIVAALVAEHGPSKVPAYTVGFEDRSYDESSAATRIAAHLGLEHHIVRADGAAIDRVVKDMLPSLDEPLADPSIIPMLLLCERASRDVKGLLGGDGADEFHLGYLSFQASQALAWIERLLPGTLLQALVRMLDVLPPGRRNFDPRLILRMMARAIHSRPELRFYNATAMLPLDELAAARPWSKELAPHMGAIDFTEELENFVDSELPEVDRVQRAIICHFLRDVIISKIDRAGMQWSIETRCPFLDLDLVEWSLRLPHRLQLRLGEGKALLRRLGAELLPTDVVKRRKQGFRPPLARLLRHELRDVLLDLLSARNVTRIGVFDTRLVVRMVDEHLRGAADHHRALWSLVCFHLWHRQHTERRPGLRRPALAVR